MSSKVKKEAADRKHEETARKIMNRKHEAELKRRAEEVNQDPGWEKAHYTMDAKDNPVVQALARALAEERKKKIN